MIISHEHQETAAVLIASPRYNRCMFKLAVSVLRCRHPAESQMQVVLVSSYSHELSG